MRMPHQRPSETHSPERIPSPSREPDATRRLAATVTVSVLLSAAGVAAMVVFFGSPADLRTLGRLSLPALLLALGLQIAYIVAGGLRLRILLAMAGFRLDLWRSIRAFVLGLFGAAATPGGGGHAPAMALTLARDGAGASLAWSTAIYSSILDLLFFAWSVPAAAVILHQRGLLDAGLTLLAMLVAAACLLLWYGMAHHIDKLQRLSGRVFSVAGLRRWRRSAMRFLDGVGAATETVTAGSRLAHAALSLVTAVMHLAMYAVFHAFLGALDAGMPLLQTLAVMVLVSISTHVVPTPGGSGYLEFAMSFVFSKQVEGGGGAVTAAVVGYRALTYYVPTLLGAGLGGVVLARELTGRRRSATGLEEQHAEKGSHGA